MGALSGYRVSLFQDPLFLRELASLVEKSQHLGLRLEVNDEVAMITDSSSFVSWKSASLESCRAFLDGFEEGVLSSDDAHWRTEQQEAVID